jgi:hypothetical protein
MGSEDRWTLARSGHGLCKLTAPTPKSSTGGGAFAVKHKERQMPKATLGEKQKTLGLKTDFCNALFGCTI